MNPASNRDRAAVGTDPPLAGDACRPGEVRGMAALLGWGVPIAMIAIGIFVPAWTLWLLTPAFLIIGLTCTVNALHCGRLHCYATGPLFLVAALLYGLVGAGLLPEGWVGKIGGGLFVGVALAYGAELLLGRRYLTRS